MKYDELAFVNQQLAGMLKSGVPLEGALKQLCASMRRGSGRAEFERLEADLAKGIPFDQALAARRLPEFYTAMLRVGQKGNNLPAVLNLLADYYHNLNLTWTRLKGLMVYPVIVFVIGLILSVGLATILTAITIESGDFVKYLYAGGYNQPAILAPELILVWMPVLFIALGVVAMIVGLTVPPFRNWLNWRFPAFREANLSHFATSLALLLEHGCQLRDALDLLNRLEAKRPLGKEMARWQERLAAGQTRISDLASGGRIIPPLFIWLVASSGEDWVSGLHHAADIFHRRAMHRIELALYAAMPVSILVLGVLIVLQALPAVTAIQNVMDALLWF